MPTDVDLDNNWSSGDRFSNPQSAAPQRASNKSGGGGQGQMKQQRRSSIDDSDVTYEHEILHRKQYHTHTMSNNTATKDDHHINKRGSAIANAGLSKYISPAERHRRSAAGNTARSNSVSVINKDRPKEEKVKQRAFSMSVGQQVGTPITRGGGGNNQMMMMKPKRDEFAMSLPGGSSPSSSFPYRQRQRQQQSGVSHDDMSVMTGVSGGSTSVATQQVSNTTNTTMSNWAKNQEDSSNNNNNKQPMAVYDKRASAKSISEDSETDEAAINVFAKRLGGGGGGGSSSNDPQQQPPPTTSGRLSYTRNSNPLALSAIDEDNNSKYNPDKGVLDISGRSTNR